MIPVRTQNAVDREYASVQDELWEKKHAEAERMVEEFLAREFPEYFKRKFLDPFEETSLIYLANKRILENASKNSPFN
jgi:hypothetical protein